jgi:hypothetical protein
VTLSPLPCWEHLSPKAQKEKLAELVRVIEAPNAGVLFYPSLKDNLSLADQLQFLSLPNLH